RDVQPQKIIIAALYQREVREAIAPLQKEFTRIEWVGVWGDVFVRADFAHTQRAALLQSAAQRADLYQDLFQDVDAAFARSRLAQLILEHKPNVIVDTINTATAISYQDMYSATIVAQQQLNALWARIDALKESTTMPRAQVAATASVEMNAAIAREQSEHVIEETHRAVSELAKLSRNAKRAFDALVLSQSIPQLIRHVILILRAMEQVGTRLYLKIGTTGTGGMGLNIPYTHGEDKPSSKLMSKTAVAFAHTGLMFLMARTPGAPIVKEIKPAAMIGYADITLRSITERGAPVLVYESKIESLADALTLADDATQYKKLGKLKVAVVDTGENGMFTKGEFETITAIQQMEFITPEEIASKVVLEIKGSNTGADVIAAIDGAVLDPTYRAGFLRRAALEEIERLETETGVPSIALGQLGPPELSKLLFEAYLLKERYHTLDTVMKQKPKKIADALYRYLKTHDELRRTIISIGLPILAPDGAHIWRGPFIRIPERADTNRVPLTLADVDKFAQHGWVDLRRTHRANAPRATTNSRTRQRGDFYRGVSLGRNSHRRCGRVDFE
ncbi:MAG: hypothetical protein HY257_03455, partial [Chloroflexi bacterium]|nr:hypothetical protein [Chloroflexota bacterium]